LTAEQKKVFDAEHAKMGGRHGDKKHGEKGDMQNHKDHQGAKPADAPKK
jgi:hypothetical protein